MLGLSAPETGRVRPATGLSYIYICNSICGVSYIHMHVCVWLHKYVGMHMYKGSGHMGMSGKTPRGQRPRRMKRMYSRPFGYDQHMTSFSAVWM